LRTIRKDTCSEEREMMCKVVVASEDNEEEKNN
jgi:hypothetical protein